MGTPNRWLLMRSGSHLLAAPLSQVGRLVEDPQTAPDEDGPGDATTPAAHLGCVTAEDAGPGLVVWVRGAAETVTVRVGSAEEVVDEQEMLPLPRLLCRALGDDSPVIGAILWQGRPVPVVDLTRSAR